MGSGGAAHDTLHAADVRVLDGDPLGNLRVSRGGGDAVATRDEVVGCRAPFAALREFECAHVRPSSGDASLILATVIAGRGPGS